MKTMSTSSSSRRSFLCKSLGGVSLLALPAAPAANDPTLYLQANAVSANLLAIAAAGQLHPNDLNLHYFNSTSLFLYLASNNLNSLLPGLITQVLQTDPYVLNRLPETLDTVRSRAGVWYHPELVNQVYTPTVTDMLQGMGDNFGHAQSAFADGMLQAMSPSTPLISLRNHHPALYQRQIRLRQALSLRPRLRLVEDKTSPGLGTLLTSAGVLIGGGSALVSLSGTNLAAATAVSLSSGLIFALGAGLIFAGVALGAYGIYTSIQAMHAAPPIPGDPRSPDLPCYYEVPPCPRSDQN